MPKMLERLRDLVLGGKCDDSNGTAPALVIRVRCNRCGEEITTRIEKAHASKRCTTAPTPETTSPD